ncbi:MAG: LptF/LptG family permease [Myxococcota bacterium]
MSAPRIVWRSILAEVMAHAALGLALIGLLLLVQNLLRYLEELASIGLGAWDVARLVVALLPVYLPYAIPTSILFGILITFGRMSADGEVVALRASGIGIAQLLPPVLGAGLVGTVVLAGLLFEAEPYARLQLKSITRELGTSAHLALPGKFRPVGKRTFYVHSEGNESCPLQGVFIADFTRGDDPFYVEAQCGAFRSEPKGIYLMLELTDGSVEFPSSDPARYRRLHFARMETYLDLSRYLAPGRRSRDLDLGELLEADAAFRRGEGPELRGREGALEVRVQIHRRLAFSLSCLLLAALAVPLGVRPVRAGRSWGALVAITVMAAYWLVLAGGQLAAESGLVSPAVGLWTSDVLVFLLAFALVRRLRRVEV